MGLFKLALIGGAAYYAGKKFNEGSNGNPQQQGQQNGKCQGWGRNWHNRHNNPDMSQQQGPGMTREVHAPNAGGVYENNEKSQAQYQHQQPQRQQQDYPAGYGNGWGYAQQYQDYPRETTKQMIKIEDEADRPTAAMATPPAYGRSLSPQQRMFPQQETGYAEKAQWK